MDDHVLCANLARRYRDIRRLGPGGITGALLVRKFPRELVEQAVRAVSGPDEELAAATAALAKRFRGSIPEGREGAARAFRFLSRRGFSPETCRQAIRKMSDDNVEGEG